MPRSLESRFRGLGIDVQGGASRRKSFMDVTHRDVKYGKGGGPKIEAVRRGVSVANSLLFGPVGSTVSNWLTRTLGKNPESRDISPGEKHILLPTKHGVTRANFAGPGTKVKKRLKRGDKGVDGPRGVDALAKQHDIAYVNAKTPADVRAADNKMIRDLRNSTAGRATKAVVSAALKAKKLGEDLGVFDVNTFTQVTEDDSVPGAKSSAGRGSNAMQDDEDPLPADQLLDHVLKHVRKPGKAPASNRRPESMQGDGFLSSAFGAAKILGPVALKFLLPIVLDQLKKVLINKVRSKLSGSKGKKRKR